MHRILREYEQMSMEPPAIEPARIRTGIDRIHLEAALAVNLHGTFCKAAEALNTKSGTVNRRIRDLEFQIGISIFERHKRRAVPTRLGRIFLNHTGRLLLAFYTMVEGVRRVADGNASEIVIGCCGPVITGPLHDLLFNPAYAPDDVRVVPAELAQEHLLDALAAEKIDLAIMAGLPGRFRGKSAKLWDEALLVLLPVDHALAGRAVVTWDDLAGQTLVLSRRDTPEALRDLLRARLGCDGALRVVERDVGTATLAHLVARGQGFALGLAHAPGFTVTGIATRPLLGETGLEHLPVHACWLAEPSNPAFARYRAHVLRRFPRAGDDGVPG